MAGKGWDEPSGTRMMEPVAEGTEKLVPIAKHPFALVNEEGLILRRREVNRQVRPCTYASHIGATKGQRKWGGQLIMRETGAHV